MKSVAKVSLSDGLSTALGPTRQSRQVLVALKLRAWVKSGFSSAATSTFYTFSRSTFYPRTAVEAFSASVYAN